MLELKQLSICNYTSAVELYRKMIEENRVFDERLRNLDTDDKSIRKLLQYSYDTENNLFFLAYQRNSAVGFIDSTRVTKDNGPDEWYIKAVYLAPEYRSSKNFEFMVYKTEKLVRQKGVKNIFSNALMENNEANTLWENLGYTIESDKRTKGL